MDAMSPELHSSSGLEHVIIPAAERGPFLLVEATVCSIRSAIEVKQK